MPRVLLHICCGPCAIYPVVRLRDEGFEVTGLFYNPNIQPLTEYLRRRDALQQAAERLEIQVIYKDDYDPAAYFRNISFREDNRCFYCYSDRLKRAHSIAKRGGFDFFTTTILYSKMQKHDLAAQVCRDVSGGSKTGFLYRDFREGWKQGIAASKDWGLYRQQYCGCLLSEAERYASELKSRK